MATNRRSLAAIILIASMGGSDALAQCAECAAIGSYGSSVNSNINSATSATLNTTQSVTQAYTETAKSLYDTADTIVAAIQASSSTVSTEVIRASEAQTRMLEVLKNRLEQIAQTRLIADTNIESERTHGPQNIHSDACISLRNKDVRDQAVAVGREVLQDFRVRQERTRASDFRGQFVDGNLLSMADLQAKTYRQGDAEVALEQVVLVTGESAIPVSPDTVAALASASVGNTSPESIQLMAGWLRTSAASREVAQQIAKRTRPELPEDQQPVQGQEPFSEMEEMWDASTRALSMGAIIEDADAGEIKLLRGIARRQSLNNKIRLEQLENALSIARLSASQLGYLAEQSFHLSKSGIEQSLLDNSIRKGSRE